MEVIGPGRLKELAGIFEDQSIRSCFVVADPTAFVSSGASETLQPLLDSLETVTVFSDFAPNPDDTSVEKARHLATQSAYDAIVAVGGGIGYRHREARQLQSGYAIERSRR